MFYERAHLRVETDEHAPEIVVSKILVDPNLQAVQENA